VAILDVVGGLAGLNGDWEGLVVYFAGTAWDGNRGSDQHVAERLAGYAPVLYVDPPRSVLGAARVGGLRHLNPRLERLGDRLLRLTPLAPPGPNRPGVRSAGNVLARQTVRTALRRLGATPDVVVVASLSPFLNAVPARLRVLYGTDDFVAGAQLMGLAAGWLRRLERRQLNNADLVIAVSDELAARWQDRARSLVVIENGCDDRLFGTADDAAPPDDVVLPGPVAGLIGHLSERIDFGLLEAVADSGHSLLLVGPCPSRSVLPRLQALLAQPNVQWTGPRPFSDLPRYLRVIDVGLVPYADTPFNRASFPLKTLEYLAAGRPTVVTDLPAMRALPADVITVAGEADSFLAAVTAALAAPPDAAAAHRRRQVAAEHGWDVRARRFAEVLGLLSPDAVPT
jgi:teichuronic acid biosynthesis glycosyltransferase TuaH